MQSYPAPLALPPLRDAIYGAWAALIGVLLFSLAAFAATGFRPPRLPVALPLWTAYAAFLAWSVRAELAQAEAS